MKIACICNMNNNFFSLVRYLRDSGYDAELLLLNNEKPHFGPESDTFDKEYLNFTSKLTWGDRVSFRTTSRENISHSLNKYNILIGCGTVPAFVSKSGRNLDVFVPFGSDLFSFPFRDRSVHPRKILRAIRNQSFVSHQNSGICTAKFISTDLNNSWVKYAFSRMNIRSELSTIPVPMVYSPLYNSNDIKKVYSMSKWFPKFKKIRDESDLLVFHHSRHLWKSVSAESDSNKGTDILIKGFAKFVSKNQNYKAILILFNYGNDSEHSKNLIDSLGIGENVRWFPLMERKEIMVGLSLADVGTGQFKGGVLIGGTILETLAMGKPMLHYLDESNYQSGHYTELYPLMNARTPDQITRLLDEYKEDPDKFIAIGHEANSWFKRHFVDSSVKEYERFIRESMKRNHEIV